MEDNTYIQIGKITGSFGGDGFVKVKIFDGYEDEIYQQDFIFIIQENIHVPYRIVEKNLSKKLLRFDDISTMRKAEVLRNKGLYLIGTSDISNTSEENNYLINYTIIDNNLGEIGVIKDIVSMTHQDIAHVEYQDKIIMIPLHPLLMDKMDEEQKTLLMNLPEGILELEG